MEQKLAKRKPKIMSKSRSKILLIVSSLWLHHEHVKSPNPSVHRVIQLLRDSCFPVFGLFWAACSWQVCQGDSSAIVSRPCLLHVLVGSADTSVHRAIQLLRDSCFPVYDLFGQPAVGRLPGGIQLPPFLVLATSRTCRVTRSLCSSRDPTFARFVFSSFRPFWPVCGWQVCRGIRLPLFLAVASLCC